MKIGFDRTTGGLALLYFSSFALSFGQGMILPTLPLLVTEFGISIAGAAQVITVYALGRFIALIPAGVLLDRLGSRLAVVAAPIIITAAVLAVALQPSYPLLLVAMLLAGGAEAIWNMGREIAGVELVRPDQRGRLISGLMGASTAGQALGAALGGVLLEYSGFQTVFLFYGLMSLGVAALSVFARSTVSGGQAHAKPRAGNSGFQWLSPFSLAQLTQDIDPGLRRMFLVLVLATFVMTMYRMLVQAMVPLYAGSHLHFSPSQIGFLFSIMGGIVFVMIVPAGLIIDKLGRKWAIVPSTALPAVALVLIPLSGTFLQLAVLFVILGVANGMSLGSVAVATYDILPAGSRGRLQAMRRTFAEVGGICGPLFGGMLAGATTPGVPFLVVAPILLLTALLLAFGTRETLVKRARQRNR